VTGRKRHLVVDTLGLVLLVLVTAAHVQDRDGARLVLQALFERIKHSTYSRWCRLTLIWADGGYRGELNDVEHPSLRALLSEAISSASQGDYFGAKNAPRNDDRQE
jgi:hypothetical protein